MSVFDICDTELRECIICKEENVKYKTQCCRVDIHESCLKEWYKKSNNFKCPHCRKINFTPIHNYNPPLPEINNNDIFAKIGKMIKTLQAYFICKYILFPLIETSLIILIYSLSITIQTLLKLYYVTAKIGFYISIETFIFIIKSSIVVIGSIISLLF